MLLLEVGQGQKAKTSQPKLFYFHTFLVWHGAYGTITTMTLKNKAEKVLLYASLFYVIYMPFHVFIVQYGSSLFGTADIWKGAKDALLLLIIPVLALAALRKNLLKERVAKNLLIVCGAYTLLHILLALVINTEGRAEIIGLIFNLRIIGFLSLGYVVGAIYGPGYIKWLLKVSVLLAAIVSFFGILQYFILPDDFLVQFGYGFDKGVKALFYIDDKIAFPRIMSTQKDPNSLGSYLILPIVTIVALLTDGSLRKKYAAGTINSYLLFIVFAMLVTALVLTFSRGALLSLMVSVIIWLAIYFRKSLRHSIKKIITGLACLLLLSAVFVAPLWRTSLFQNIVFHADQTTIQDDPNELRVKLYTERVREVINAPVGNGPGKAGLASINNTSNTVLTENYPLQIAYEVGVFGLSLYIALHAILFLHLKNNLSSRIHVMFLSVGIGYLFNSMFIHLWSYEAVTFQWWFFAGLILATGKNPTKNLYNNPQ